MSPHPKRRALVLTTEGARHPFRRSLPPHVFVPLPADEPPRRTSRQIWVEDWKSIFSTYCAAFVAVTLFVA
jgi:hypothetical protein